MSDSSPPKQVKEGNTHPNGGTTAKHKRVLFSFALSSFILAATCGTVSILLLKILLFLSFKIFQKVYITTR